MWMSTISYTDWLHCGQQHACGQHVPCRQTVRFAGTKRHARVAVTTLAGTGNAVVDAFTSALQHHARRAGLNVTIVGCSSPAAMPSNVVPVVVTSLHAAREYDDRLAPHVAAVCQSTGVYQICETCAGHKPVATL